MRQFFLLWPFLSQLNSPSNNYFHSVCMTLYTVGYSKSAGRLHNKCAHSNDSSQITTHTHTHTPTYKDRHSETHALVYTHTHTQTHLSPSTQFHYSLLRTLSPAPEDELVTPVCICTQTLPDTNTTGTQGHTCMCKHTCSHVRARSHNMLLHLQLHAHAHEHTYVHEHTHENKHASMTLLLCNAYGHAHIHTNTHTLHRWSGLEKS